MTFKASKERKPRADEPMGKGTPLIPPATVRAWYKNQMNKVVSSMVEDYRREVEKALMADDVRRIFAEDASARSIFKKVLASLNTKWKSVFNGFAKKTAKEFVYKSDKASKASINFSLQTAGVKEPRFRYDELVNNTLNSAQDFNHTLITNIQTDVHERIYESVMLSLTSPNPEEQGQSGIESALKKIGGFASDRVELIARDQTSKLYSALADERMSQNGIDSFEWQHSSAGKTQRQAHVDKDGQIFKLNDPRLWEGRKQDVGPPGWAINCRCRRIPVVI